MAAEMDAGDYFLPDITPFIKAYRLIQPGFQNDGRSIHIYTVFRHPVLDPKQLVKLVRQLDGPGGAKLVF